MPTRAMERTTELDFDDDDEFDRPPQLHVTDADSFERGAACGGLAIHVSSQCFRSGQVTAVFSGVTVDFREAVLAAEGATLSVQAALSSIDVLVPAHWRVVCEVDAVLGGVRGQRPGTVAGATSAPCLRVTGTVVASGLSVR
jgi:predicted membrane protein